MLSVAVEGGICYGFATSVLLARLLSRVLHFGSLKRLQIEDWLMVITLCFYTTAIVAMNIVVDVQTNLLPPGYLDHHVMSQTEKAQRSYGSKMVLVVEQCQCCTIWLVKACILIMYHHITVASFPMQNLMVKILAAYVAFGFVFMEIFYFGVWCRPFSNYWAVPTPNIQCSAAIDHLITNAVFNISSDLILLCIALPMFWRSIMPLRRKLALCVVFGLGLFVTLCAILNKYYSFTHPFGSMWTHWYIIESSAAVMVANLPFTLNLVRQLRGKKVISSSSKDFRDDPHTGASSSSRVNRFKQHFSVISGQRVSQSRGSSASNRSSPKDELDRLRPSLGGHKSTDLAKKYGLAEKWEDIQLETPRDTEAGFHVVSLKSPDLGQHKINDLAKKYGLAEKWEDIQLYTPRNPEAPPLKRPHLPPKAFLVTSRLTDVPN